MNDAQLSSAQARALILSKAIKRRDDVRIRMLIEDFDSALDYEEYGLEELAISDKAWACVQRLKLEPKMVFAHPALLQQYPKASLYYRGIATLSLKRVSSMATNVDAWENPSQGKRHTAKKEAVFKVTRLYNAVISSIVEGTDAWALENGYRNILATIGISQDGKMRNIIGQEAERAVRDKLLQWIKDVGIPCEQKGAWFELGAILGVVTSAMRAELDQMKIVDFDLYDVVNSKEGWDRFVEELFCHKLRLLLWKN